MGSLSFLIKGFLAKIIAGADDTLTHTPLISLLTKTKEGKFIFISGMFTSILILIAISIVFANLLQSIPYKNIISALLLLILAAVVYCNRYIHLGRKKYFAWAKRAVFQRPKSLTLFGTGMLVFLATGIDDLIVYSALLTTTLAKQLLVATGILAATILELMAVFYFSKAISQIKHLEKITIAGLIILAILVGFQII